jgi:hypothetical protein
MGPMDTIAAVWGRAGALTYLHCLATTAEKQEKMCKNDGNSAITADRLRRLGDVMQRRCCSGRPPGVLALTTDQLRDD